jgi:hypothetical protein
MKSEWRTIWDDRLGEAKIEFNDGCAFLHVTLRDAPIEGMRKIREVFPYIKGLLRNLGHSRVYVIIPEGDNKLYRFERFFGFKEIRRYGGQIFMGQEC